MGVMEELCVVRKVSSCIMSLLKLKFSFKGIFSK